VHKPGVDDLAVGRYLAGVPANNPLYGGKMTVSRQREVKNVTSDAMVKLHKVWSKHRCRSGSGIRCLFDPWIRDPGWVKKSRSGPGIRIQDNIPDHISESLETIFGLNTVLIFFDADADPGSGNLFDPGSGIQDGKKFGSGIREKHP
jgi:hypothetical protein